MRAGGHRGGCEEALEVSQVMRHLTGWRQRRWTGHVGKESRGGMEPQLNGGRALPCLGEKSTRKGIEEGNQGFGVWTC